jgi:hypothetical protein
MNVGLDQAMDSGLGVVARVNADMDPGINLSVGLGLDLGVDISIDAAVDALVDTALAIAVDMGVDIGLDAALDVGVDLVMDVGVNVSVLFVWNTGNAPMPKVMGAMADEPFSPLWIASVDRPCESPADRLCGPPVRMSASAWARV